MNPVLECKKYGEPVAVVLDHVVYVRPDRAISQMSFVGLRGRFEVEVTSPSYAEFVAKLNEWHMAKRPPRVVDFDAIGTDTLQKEIEREIARQWSTVEVHPSSLGATLWNEPESNGRSFYTETTEQAGDVVAPTPKFPPKSPRNECDVTDFPKRNVTAVESYLSHFTLRSNRLRWIDKSRNILDLDSLKIIQWLPFVDYAGVEIAEFWERVMRRAGYDWGPQMLPSLDWHEARKRYLPESPVFAEKD